MSGTSRGNKGIDCPLLAELRRSLDGLNTTTRSGPSSNAAISSESSKAWRVQTAGHGLGSRTGAPKINQTRVIRGPWTSYIAIASRVPVPAGNVRVTLS